MSIIEPLHQLAFSVQSLKGVYAVLIGSGLSSAAGIPTGFQITSDLIKRLAIVAGEQIENSDPFQWFRLKYKSEPTYSSVLEHLGKTPLERQQILSAYIEPTDEERRNSRKIPTLAHASVARLAKLGYIKVIVTTNFDRLMEDALTSEGVRHEVLSSSEDINGSMPLKFHNVTVLKVNGDYKDSSIKNTENELAKYTSKMSKTIKSILDDHAFIFCGWSLKYDIALSTLLRRNLNFRFQHYWSFTDNITPEAEIMIEAKKMTKVQIRSADIFFRDLCAIAKSAELKLISNPIQESILVSQVKSYLRSQDDLAIEELFDGVGKNVFQELLEIHDTIRRDGKSGNDQNVYSRIFACIQPLIAMSAVACSWATDKIGAIVANCIDLLSTVESGNGSLHAKYSMYHVAAMFYSCGISALAGRKYKALKELLYLPSYSNGNVYSGSTACAPFWSDMESVLSVHGAVVQGNVRSAHFKKVLRPVLSALIVSERAFNNYFEEYEYLLTLVHLDLAHYRNMKVTFAGDYLYPPHECRDKILSIRAKYGSDLLPHYSDSHGGVLIDAGFFNGRIQRGPQVANIIEDYQKQQTSVSRSG